MLSNYLLALLGMLDLDRESNIYRDVITISNFLSCSKFKIAVFAPFNHGKSTLLNAILGSKTLPIDLVPTTGSIIEIIYGEQLETTITLKDGKQITDLGTKILKSYTVINNDRDRNIDRKSKDNNNLSAENINYYLKKAQVKCNHALLKSGVELIDLPGTNDRIELDRLIQDNLLSTNLIIQVLDARKLMTLGEKEHLQNWLQRRGVQNIIFVVNFMNLLSTEEQSQVKSRLELIAQDFSFILPEEIKNIYCVDALPALRGRIKEDEKTIGASGILEFESALETIVTSQQKIPKKELPQVQKTISNILQYADSVKDELNKQINSEQEEQEKQVLIREKAAKLITLGLNKSFVELENFLDLENLLQKEQPSLTIAIQQERFTEWQQKFKQQIDIYQQNIQEWIDKSQEFYSKGILEPLSIKYPSDPQINLDNNFQDCSSFQQSQDRNKFQFNKITEEVSDFIENTIPNNINSLFNAKIINTPKQTLETQTEDKCQLYINAADLYLSQFSEGALFDLKIYQQEAREFVIYQPKKVIKDTTSLEYELKLLENLISNIKTEL